MFAWWVLGGRRWAPAHRPSSCDLAKIETGIGEMLLQVVNVMHGPSVWALFSEHVFVRFEHVVELASVQRISFEVAWI